jgi:PPOX class probable F420-dependent enzyme
MVASLTGVAKLTDEQAKLFLDKNFGAVATIREDGTPHVTPVWIDYDGEHVVFNTATGRAKWRHLQRDPRVTIEVTSMEDPYEYVTVSGTAELEEGEEANRHIDKMSEKYTGNPKFQSHRPGERRVIVRVKPDRVR